MSAPAGRFDTLRHFLPARAWLAAPALTLAGVTLVALAGGQPAASPEPPPAPQPDVDGGMAPNEPTNPWPAPTDPGLAPPVAPPPAAPPAPAPPPPASGQAPFSYGYGAAAPAAAPPTWGGWGAPGVPPGPPKPRKPPDGQTEAGLPFAQRGRIAVDFATYLSADDPDNYAAAMNLVATVPLATRTFVEANLPFSILVPLGNPTVGVHYVGQLSKQLWLTGGGALGIPVLQEELDEAVRQAIPRALWNVHQHWADIFPLQVRLGLEYHASFLALRAQLEPSLWFPLGRSEDVDGAFQHALEVQLGHGIGGGLRIQGVALGSGLGSGRNADHYQLALSPFFAVTRELGFLRLGLMMPMDPELGPPFEQSWGFLATTGLHLD